MVTRCINDLHNMCIYAEVGIPLLSWVATLVISPLLGQVLFLVAYVMENSPKCSILECDYWALLVLAIYGNVQ